MRARLTPYLLLFVMVAAIYAPSLGGAFLQWDDTQHFQFNPWLLEGQAGHFWTNAFYGMFIPMTYSVWTGLYALSSSPFLFHFMNLCLHAANAAMVFILARRLFPALTPAAALTGALVFVCHPLQAEPVSWISGGRDLLAAFFALAAWLSATECARRGRVSNAMKAFYFLDSSVLFALSLLSKPALLFLPVAVAWLQHMQGRRLVSRAVLASWAVLSAAAGWLALTIQGPFAAKHIASPPLWQRAVIAVDSIGFYTGKLILPWPLMADYSRIPHVVIADHLFVPSLFLVAALAGFAYWLRGKPEGRGLVGAMLFILLPVLGLLPFAAQKLSTVFDRYMYFALVPVALIAAHLAQDVRVRRALAALIVVWSSLSVARVLVWRDDRSLAEDMVAKNPLSYDGHNNLALVEIEARNWAAAKRLLREAASLNPGSAVAWSNLAFVHWSENDMVPIFADIDSRLASKLFVDNNAGEPRALALMYRMGARAHASVRDLAVAKDYYCHALRYDGGDGDLSKEAQTFFQQAFKGQGC